MINWEGNCVRLYLMAFKSLQTFTKCHGKAGKTPAFYLAVRSSDIAWRPSAIGILKFYDDLSHFTYMYT